VHNVNAQFLGSEIKLCGFRNFDLSAEPKDIEFFVDHRTARAQELRVNVDGTFSVRLSAVSTPGRHSLTVKPQYNCPMTKDYDFNAVIVDDD
jgi:hypothetical protein